MGKLSMNLDWGGNAAFQDADWRFEIADIFSKIAEKIENLGGDETEYKKILRDSNGNTVGCIFVGVNN